MSSFLLLSEAISKSLVAGTSKAASRGRQDQGRSLPDAARGWERVSKNKGELSGLRRANSDAVDNETSAHDRGTVNG